MTVFNEPVKSIEASIRLNGTLQLRKRRSDWISRMLQSALSKTAVVYKDETADAGKAILIKITLALFYADTTRLINIYFKDGRLHVTYENMTSTL